jgi:hypothetical protein
MFWENKELVCPYCLQKNKFRKELAKCQNPNCRQELPINYDHSYFEAPPSFAQIIGYSQVGKSVYFQTLTLMLTYLSKVWEQIKFAPSAETEPTQHYMDEADQIKLTGKLPKPTQLGLQDAYIIKLHKMERWGSRTLILRDVAGEHCQNFVFPVDRLPYLTSIPTALMMFSIHDMAATATAMPKLINGYIKTLLQNKVRLEKEPHTLIVVLSKADMLLSRLPANLRKYLEDDPFTCLIDSSATGPNQIPYIPKMDAKELQNYIDKMDRASTEIRSWLKYANDGAITLFNQAEANNISLKFTIISSTGTDPGVDRTLPVSVRPTRVLDPFFWIMETQSRPSL